MSRVAHVFVAPHPDDIALSCGGLVAALAARGEDVAIVTVYSGIGDGAALTPYQREALGFGAPDGTAAETVGAAGIAHARNLEDEAYARLFGVRMVRLDLPDAVYRGYEGDEQLTGPVHADDAPPIEPLRRALGELGATDICAPLGVGNHVDHVLCRDAVLALAAEADTAPPDAATHVPPPRTAPPAREARPSLRLYEDFPYAARMEFRGPGVLPGGGRSLPPDRELALPPGSALRPEYVGISPWLERKAEGIAAYASQVGRQFEGSGGVLEALRTYHARVAREGELPGHAERYWVVVADREAGHAGSGRLAPPARPDRRGRSERGGRTDPLAPQPPMAPRLPRGLGAADAPVAAELHDVTWRAIRADGWSLPGAGLAAVEFAGCRLETVDLSGAQCSRLVLADAEVNASNLANLAARDSSLIRVTLRRARLTGMGWPAGTLTDVRVEDCRADLSSFRFGRLQRVTFVRCLLADADFEGVRGESVAFLDCDLSRAAFSQARFERSEIRRCRLDGVSGVDGLRGMGLLPEDIVSLAGPMAAALGVRTLAP